MGRRRHAGGRAVATRWAAFQWVTRSHAKMMRTTLRILPLNLAPCVIRWKRPSRMILSRSSGVFEPRPKMLSSGSTCP